MLLCKFAKIMVFGVGIKTKQCRGNDDTDHGTDLPGTEDHGDETDRRDRREHDLPKLDPTEALEKNVRTLLVRLVGENNAAVALA